MSEIKREISAKQPTQETSTKRPEFLDGMPLREQAVELLARGFNRRQTAHIIGKSEKTLNNWKNEKDEKTGKFPFVEAVKTRRAELSTELKDSIFTLGEQAVATLRKAMKGDKCSIAGIKAAEMVLRKLGAIGDDNTTAPTFSGQMFIKFNPLSNTPREDGGDE